MESLWSDSLSKVPVLALGWSQDAANKNACFSDGRSIYAAIDGLMRGWMTPDDWCKSSGERDYPNKFLYTDGSVDCRYEQWQGRAEDFARKLL